MRVSGNATASLVRGVLKIAIRGILIIVGLLIVYLAAALIGTVWTVAGENDAGSRGSNTIYVLSNGFHSDIALPVKDGRPPEGLPVNAADLPGGLDNTGYLIIGWGSQTAYTSLLALSDMTAAIAFKALLFDKSVMHVLPYPGELRGQGVYRLELSDAQYQLLVEFISDTFSSDNTGQPEVLAGITQGFGDIFYRARRRFSAFYGCNAWTGEALRKAGVPVGRWTPFAQSIEWNMSRISVDDHFDSEM